MLFAALKDKEVLTTIMEENLRFKQLRLNDQNKQKNKKEHLRLGINSIRVGVVSSVLE